MAGEVLTGRKLFRVALNRTGETVTIYRADGTATENKYGKIEDGDRTFSKVTSEVGRLTYESMEERPTESRVQGGRVNTESPIILFRDDTQAREDDRVVFDGFGDGSFGSDVFGDARTYTLDERVPRDNYVAFKATLVNG